MKTLLPIKPIVSIRDSFANCALVEGKIEQIRTLVFSGNFNLLKMSTRPSIGTPCHSIGLLLAPCANTRADGAILCSSHHHNDILFTRARLNPPWIQTSWWRNAETSWSRRSLAAVLIQGRGVNTRTVGCQYKVVGANTRTLCQVNKMLIIDNNLSNNPSLTRLVGDLINTLIVQVETAVL